MGKINLFKIDSANTVECLSHLDSKMDMRNEKEFRDARYTFNVKLYLKSIDVREVVNWNWVLEAFEQDPEYSSKTPQAVVLFQGNINDQEVTYAVTFGAAYFIIDKYCDRDFGFDFASRIEHKNIKTTTLAAPASRRNKTINTFVNYNELHFDSGESFLKLKVSTKLEDGFELFKETLEIGNSIHFVTNSNSMANIIEIILFVQDKIRTQERLYGIPLFLQVKDNTLLRTLDDTLESLIRNEEYSTIVIPELEIIGSTEILNHNDDTYQLKHERKSKDVTILNVDEITLFCNENDIDIESNFLKIKIVKSYENNRQYTKQVKDIIEYTDDTEKCVLSGGKWYKYNTDYINYLNLSIKEVDTHYHREYDFNGTIHDQYIEDVFIIEKDYPIYIGINDNEIKRLLKIKYYAERCFNILRGNSETFVNYDRSLENGIEIMDLYESSENIMFAVKIGQSSSKLCFVIDQSLMALQHYKNNNNLENRLTIKSVGLWFILKRDSQLPIDTRDMVDLTELNMLMLKSKIAHWKNEVRLAGYKPIIYINYRT